MLNFIAEAERLIRISSISKDGNEEIALHVSDLMGRVGFKTSLQQVAHSVEGVSKRQFNVIGIMGNPLVDGATKKGLLLNTHIDTVSPGVKAHWTETGGDPFRATIKGDRIFGLGSADVKLDLLCKLKAAERFRDRKLKMPLYVAATAAEEIGMLGAKYLIKSKIVNPKHVLVGEPSELAVIHAHKAFVVYQVGVVYNEVERDARGFNTRIELRCVGKSAHGSYPHLGTNAVRAMLDVVRKIKEAKFDFRISKIAGGDSVNKVPDHAVVEFYLSSSAFDDFRKFCRELLSHRGIQIEFGGVGESGMKFLPDNVFEAILGVDRYFEAMERDQFATNTDTTYNPSSSTVNFGQIRLQPGVVDLWFDLRLLPSMSVDELESKLRSSIAALNAGFPNLNLKLTRNRFNPGLDMPADSELVRAASEAQIAAGINAKLDKKATSTEASQYFSAGHEAIIFGPGVSMGNSHSPNEYNLIDQLDKAVHFYERMIERFCV